MLRSFAFAGSLLLAACAGSPNWSEGDAKTGAVVVALSADSTAGSFRALDLSLRRVDRSFAVDIPYTLRGMDADRRDFETDSEAGIVFAQRLPPGEYEITDLIGDRGSFWWAKETRPSQPIALRFVVAPGSTTYVGHFRVGLAQSTQEPRLAVVISDENGADIARAKSKYPDLGTITVAVPGSANDTGASAHSGALATP